MNKIAMNMKEDLNMSEEKKNVAPVEINDEELDQVAGGTDEATPWRCRYCGTLFSIKSNAEVQSHYLSCARSPFNPANK